jgi:ribosomal protein S17E
MCITEREQDVIVSLTSYPARIRTVNLTIESLLNQTFKYKRLILWLTQEEFPNKENELPSQLLDLQKKGLNIEWCDNNRPYNKLIPTLRKYRNSIIITFDDDIIYNKKAIEMLYECHKKHPKDIIAHRITRMYYDENNELSIFPRIFYRKFFVSQNYMDLLKEPSFFNKLTGVGGVLYPPDCFHPDVLDEKTFMRIAPTSDDIWFWLQAVRNTTRICVPAKHFPKLILIPKTQNVGLCRINDNGDKLFFVHLKNILEQYPDIKDILEHDNIKNKQIINYLMRPIKKILHRKTTVLNKLRRNTWSPRKAFFGS